MHPTNPAEVPVSRARPRWGTRLRAALLVLAAALPLALACLAWLVHHATGQRGWRTIAADEIAVRIDYLDGTLEVIERPGHVFFLPWLQEVLVLDKAPRSFGLAGPSKGEDKAITVRAADGSSFWFEGLELQYRARSDALPTLLARMGNSDLVAREWIGTGAAVFLAEEYGRFGAQEASDGAVADGAKLAAVERLEELLEEHGIELLQLVAPKPRFEREYERAIDDRKLADQEMARLADEVADALEARESRMLQLADERERERVALDGTLVERRIQAQGAEAKLRGGADAYRLERQRAADGLAASLAAKVRLAEEQAAWESAALAAEVEALAARGPVAVREVLVGRLATIPFTLEPARGADEAAILAAVAGSKAGKP